MRIWTADYALKPRQALSAKAKGSERVGSLLKVETASGIGYADLHPWPELGDEPLAVQLSRLREGHTTPLSSRSLTFAELDAQARARGESLFKDLSIPESHRLIHRLDDASLDEARMQGFRVVKLKADAETRLEGMNFGELRLRLDFNGDGEAALKRLSPDLPIDFIEDPLPYWDLSRWPKWPWPLAFDRGDVAAVDKAAFTWLVAKPALQDPEQMLAHAKRLGVRLTVTSYLDHPVGQMSAAWAAAQLGGEVGVCGLATHLSYESHSFSECLQMKGPRLQAPEGTGVGFDDLLARQKWRLLA